jgi:radical SAM superfamily enzyme YgiQ (UPF0313 family)
MKVVLVQPGYPDYLKRWPYRLVKPRFLAPACEPPLGLLYLAAHLELNGVEVEVIDNILLNLPNDALARTVLRLRPDLVGITANSVVFPSAAELAASLKDQAPGVSTVLGGPFVSIDPKRSIESPGIDLAVLGDGEVPLLQIVHNLGDPDALSSVKGILFKHNDEVVQTELPTRFPDLDTLPLPARHKIPLTRYPRAQPARLDVTPVDNICASRGCVYKCTYCSVTRICNKTYRSRDPVKVVDEIQFLIANYGTRGINFYDDNFTMNRGRTLALCDEILRRRVDVRWTCMTRPDLVDAELLHLMKLAGCDCIAFGIETGSQRLLDFMKKGLTLEQIKTAVRLCKGAKIQTHAYFMFGIPIETRIDYFRTLKLLIELNLDGINTCHYIAFPDSDLYQYVKTNGLYRDEWQGILFPQTPRISFYETKATCYAFNLLYWGYTSARRRLSFLT